MYGCVWRCFDCLLLLELRWLLFAWRQWKRLPKPSSIVAVGVQARGCLCGREMVVLAGLAGFMPLIISVVGVVRVDKKCV